MFATLALAATTLAAPQDQGQEERFSSVLSSREQSSLADKMRDFMEAQLEYREADREGRERARRAANAKTRRARERFMEEWDRRNRREDVMAHMGDLVAIFRNCFPYDSPPTSTTGSPQPLEVRVEGGSKERVATLVAPRRYDEDEQHRGILLVPGYDPVKGSWDDHRDHWEATWEGSGIDDMEVGDESFPTVFCIPELDDALELDPQVDLSTERGNSIEDQRIDALFRPFLLHTVRHYNIDRERMILDCGRGSSGFGLRLATYFPSRFAGLILRDAQDPGDLRLDSLTGIPVLLIDNGDNSETVGAIAKELNEKEPGTCTVLTAKGEYPYQENQAGIAEWAAGQRRQLFRSKVVLAPNHDRFQTSHWVEMGRAEQLAGLPKEDRPLLIVEADRESNHIDITARACEVIGLRLNDAIVDLDEEITVVVNGKAVLREKRGRSLTTLLDGVLLSFDQGKLFTARAQVTAPEDAEGNGPGAADGNGGGR